MQNLTNTNAVPFVYVVTTTLAANASGPVTLNLQADSYFTLVGLFGTGGADATTENALVSPNNFSVSIMDQTTGRAMTSTRVPQRIMCGNAFNGFLNRFPIQFEPQSILLFDFLNLTAGTNVITLALHGYKSLIKAG